MMPSSKQKYQRLPQADLTDEDQTVYSRGDGGAEGHTNNNVKVERSQDRERCCGGVYLRTYALCAAFLGLGVCIAMVGPTLLDLAANVHADIAHISYIFTARSVGYLVGSAVGGFLFDMFDQHLLLGLSLLLNAIGFAVIPWAKRLSVMGILVSFTGVAMGFLDTGGNVLCLNLWGQRSAPYMQALHFSFGIGAFIAPLLAKNFISLSNSTSLLLNTTVHPSIPPASEQGPHRRHVVVPNLPTAVNHHQWDSQQPITRTHPLMNKISNSDVEIASKQNSNFYRSFVTELENNESKLGRKNAQSSVLDTSVSWKGRSRNVQQEKDSYMFGKGLFTSEMMMASGNSLHNRRRRGWLDSEEEYGSGKTEEEQTEIPTYEGEDTLEEEKEGSDQNSWTVGREDPDNNQQQQQQEEQEGSDDNDWTMGGEDPDNNQQHHHQHHHHHHHSDQGSGDQEETPDENMPSTRQPLSTKQQQMRKTTKRDASSATEGKENATHTGSSVPDKINAVYTKGKEFVQSIMSEMSKLSPIRWAYLIVGVYQFLVGMTFVVFYCTSSYKFLGGQQVPHGASEPDRAFTVKVLSLLFFFFFIYVGVEVAYGSFIFSFGTKSKLHLSKNDAVGLNTLFWGTFSLVRGTAIFTTKCLSVKVILLLNLVGAIVSSLGLCVYAQDNRTLLFVATGIFGGSISTIFPSAISWAERYIHVTGKAAAVFVVGASFGEMFMPLMVGYMFERNPMWLMYFALGGSVIANVLFVALQWLVSSRGEKYALPPPNFLWTEDDDDVKMDVIEMAPVQIVEEGETPLQKITEQLRSTPAGKILKGKRGKKD
ncbi:sodium-dependent glucose transporter 1-like [Branchiostoma floridae]|uniref:Sodium-dependent glucose transporter 1-like n=2 Tax=Branchiostoma floridae TaxID=7739 RepID=A0A9J7LSV7_BRAFL|nr:sodium-dependent glucose transporter 1-like [Branchiostoma floridae]XP_035686635.1 sodium-dependent glucose transporter 1-like [Branchiostoma floridae]XP_035686636.1 sodium-dependent glucose transporter 1-like [Branchiostoma floridae]